jgi:hypothetical protein
MTVRNPREQIANHERAARQVHRCSIEFTSGTAPAPSGSAIPGRTPTPEEKKEALQWADQFQQRHERLFRRLAET